MNLSPAADALGPSKEIWGRMKPDALNPQKSQQHCLVARCQAVCYNEKKSISIKISGLRYWSGRASIVTQAEEAICKLIVSSSDRQIYACSQ